MSEVLTDTPLRVRDCLRFNYAPESKTFECDFIEPGIISYRDQGGGIELLRKEVIDEALPTLADNPVIVGHTFITSENRAELEQGRVETWLFNSEDGRYHLKGSVETQQAQTLMKVKRPSIGYQVISFGPGGVYHGIKYDKAITKIKFNHLAIVDKPRYEESTFRLNSIVSNPQNMNVFKLLKKLVTRENGADGKPTDKEIVTTESHELPGNTEVEIQGPDGKPVMVRLNELADNWTKQTTAAAPTKADADDEIEIGGKQVKVSELVEGYRKNSAAPAETPEQKTAREEKEAAEKTQRTNSFFTLHAANQTPPKTDGGYSTSSGSMRDKLALGKARY